MVAVAVPWVLWATALAAAGVIAAHLLSVVTPPRLALPTARFVPERVSRAVSRSAVPTDRWLLALRLLALALLGAALSGLSWRGARLPVTTFLVIEPPSALTDSVAWRSAVQRAAARFAPVHGYAVGTRAVTDAALPANAIDTLTVVPDTLTLAARLLVARRAASPLTDIADSVRLVIVSTMQEDATGDALRAVRETWPGRIDVVRVALPEIGTGSVADALPATSPSVRAEGPSIASAEDDVVAAAFARWPVQGGEAVRIRRAPLGARITPDDSAFAAGGGVLVQWPVMPGVAGSDVPRDSLRYAIATGGAALVAPLRWLRPLLDAGSGLRSRPIVWWSNGEVAAIERVLGEGCLRDVAFAAPTGDALLGAAAVPVLRALAARCASTDPDGRRALSAVLDSSRLLAFADTGALASATSLPASGATPPSPLTRWLLLATLLVLLGELLVRRSQAAA